MPVYFNSPGGNLDGGLALGRIMRQFGAEARVGALAALDCRSSSRPCTDADERGGVTVFAREIAPATCNSSCVYAFAGGRERSVGPGSSLGVHQFFLTRADDPQRRPLVHYSRADLAKLDSTHGVINAYLVSMGIRTEVLSMANRIEPQDIRYLTLAELLALNLTTPTFTELARVEIPQVDPAPTGSLRAMLPHPVADDSHWPMVTRAGRPFIIASIAAESRRFGAITTELAIGCPLDGERYGLTFREIIRARGDERKSARIVVDPDSALETVMRAAADSSAPSLRRTAALRADNSGVLVVEVTSAATAGYPTRLEFPARGLQNRIERLEKRCSKV